MPAAGTAGTCSPRVGGQGGQCPRGRGRCLPACRVSLGGWGQAQEGVSRSRALGSPLRAEEIGVLLAPLGSPPPSRLHPVGACKCTGITRQNVDGLHAAGRVQERLPQPRVTVPRAPPDALVRARAAPRAGPARPAGRPSRARDQPFASCATNAQDAKFRLGIRAIEAELDSQDIRLQVTVTLPAPKGLGRCLNGVWALCIEDYGSQCMHILSANLTTQNVHKT